MESHFKKVILSSVGVCILLTISKVRADDTVESFTTFNSSNITTYLPVTDGPEEWFRISFYVVGALFFFMSVLLIYTVIQACRRKKRRGSHKSDVDSVERTAPDGNISNSASLTSLGTPSYTSYGKFAESMTVERNVISISKYEVLNAAKDASPTGQTYGNDSADNTTSASRSPQKHRSDHTKNGDRRKAVIPVKRNSKKKRHLIEDGEVTEQTGKAENPPDPLPKPKKKPVAKPRQVLKRFSKSGEENRRKTSNSDGDTNSPASPKNTKGKPLAKPRNKLKRLLSGSKDQQVNESDGQGNKRKQSPSPVKNIKASQPQGICFQSDQTSSSSKDLGTRDVGYQAGEVEYELVGINSDLKENTKVPAKADNIDFGEEHYELVGITQALPENPKASPDHTIGMQRNVEISQKRDLEVSSSPNVNQKGVPHTFDQISYENVLSSTPPVTRKKDSDKESTKQTQGDKGKTWHQIRDMVKEIDLPRPNLKLPNLRNSTCDCYENHGVLMPQGRKIRLV